MSSDEGKGKANVLTVLRIELAGKWGNAGLGVTLDNAVVVNRRIVVILDYPLPLMIANLSCTSVILLSGLAAPFSNSKIYNNKVFHN